MNMLSRLLSKKAPKREELSECETSTAGPGTPIHLRVIGTSELHTGGGLRYRGLVAACGWEVDWDMNATGISRERVIERLPNQHASFRYCSHCLDSLGLQPNR